MSARHAIEHVQCPYGDFYAWTDDLITNQLKQFDAHTRNELAMLLSLLHDGDVVIDVGAHIGTFSVPFAKRVGSRGKVFAIEASPDNYELLTINIHANALEARIHPILAVACQRPHKFRQQLPPGGNSGMYYFLPAVGVDDPPSTLLIDSWLGDHHPSTAIDLLKIDTEGAEMDVLRSCKNTISRYRPIIYCEINEHALDRFSTTPKEVLEELRSHGYSLFRNACRRNSANDDFKIVPLAFEATTPPLFDVLAIHPTTATWSLVGHKRKVPQR